MFKYHVFYTDDFDKDMLNFIQEKYKNHVSHSSWRKYAYKEKEFKYLNYSKRNQFFLDNHNGDGFVTIYGEWVKLSKKEFKEVIGMPVFEIGDTVVRVSGGYGKMNIADVDEVIGINGVCYDWQTLRLSKFGDGHLAKNFKKFSKESSMKEFTKDMLVGGKHVVEYRDGSIRFVLAIGDGLAVCGLQGFRANFDDFDNNLMSANRSMAYMDIIAVYDIKSAARLDRLLERDNLNLLWKREEKSQQEIEYEKLMEQISDLQKQAEKLKPTK